MGRALRTRQSEHERAVRWEHIEKSALAGHVKELDHTIAWDEASVLCNESRWAQRKWKEVCFIEKAVNCVTNRDNGRELPDIYKTILTNNIIFKNK